MKGSEGEKKRKRRFARATFGSRGSLFFFHSFFFSFRQRADKVGFQQLLARSVPCCLAAERLLRTPRKGQQRWNRRGEAANDKGAFFDDARRPPLPPALSRREDPLVLLWLAGPLFWDQNSHALALPSIFPLVRSNAMGRARKAVPLSAPRHREAAPPGDERSQDRLSTPP